MFWRFLHYFDFLFPGSLWLVKEKLQSGCVANTSTYQAKQGNAKITTEMSKSTTSHLIFNRLLCIGPCAYGGHFPSSHKTSFSGTLTSDLVPAYIYLFICLCFNSQLTQKHSSWLSNRNKVCCSLQVMLCYATLFDNLPAEIKCLPLFCKTEGKRLKAEKLHFLCSNFQTSLRKKCRKVFKNTLNPSLSNTNLFNLTLKQYVCLGYTIVGL